MKQEPFSCPHRTDNKESAVGLIAPPWKLFFPYQRGQMPLWPVMLLAKIDGRLRTAGDLQLLEYIFEVMPDSLIAQV